MRFDKVISMVYLNARKLTAQKWEQGQKNQWPFAEVADD